jgi:hypothetical protein
MGIAIIAKSLVQSVIGRSTALPEAIVTRYPELARARWRVGGLPVRVGGWCLGVQSVSAITLWHTIWLAPDASVSEELLLHELRHVDQFASTAAFPLLYIWESVRRGYVANRFEVEARAYAARRIQGG